MKLKQLTLALSLLFLTACDKNEEEVPTETLEGTLIWSGEYRSDGCGYILITENEVYHKPINESAIDDAFKANSQTEVIVSVINYNKSVQPCRSSEPYNEIKILHIQNK